MSGAVSNLGSSQVSSQISEVEARLQKPITQLQGQQAADKAEISAWGSIQGGVSNLSGALSGLSDLSTIANRAATTASQTVATATATNTASVGQYSLSKVALAKTQEIYSGIKTSGSAPLGSGGSLNISFKNGKTENVAISAQDSNLNGIAQAINQLGGGVQASVINTTGGSRLVLQGSATGSSQAFSVAGTGGLASFSYGGSAAGSLTLAQAASDATLNINGVPVSNATNSFSSALTGVSITLAGSGSTTLSVSSSPGGLAGAVSSVATSLNAAIAAIAKETAFVPPSSASASTSSAATSGPLLGNFSASDISDQLLTAVTSAAASGLTSNAVGLTVDAKGGVSFNSATFATAYAANPTGVQALISQIYNALHGVTTTALGTTGAAGDTVTSPTGTIAGQTAGLQDNVTSLTAEETQIATANNEQIQNLIKEYTISDSAATAAQTTQAYLSIFTSIGSDSKGSGS